MGLLNAHLDQINVPCNVTTSATDHKYGGAELCYDGNMGERYLIWLISFILLSDPPSETNIHQRMQMHLTINRIEKACMFTWFQVFSLLIFLRLLSVLDHVIYVLPDRLACAR